MEITLEAIISIVGLLASGTGIGGFSIACGLVCGACAVWVYKNYQKKSDESRYGQS